jgi:hypothetical protein
LMHRQIVQHSVELKGRAGMGKVWCLLRTFIFSSVV